MTPRALLPFAATSTWRLGIAAGARFADTTDPRNIAIADVDRPGAAWANWDQYSHPIAYAAESDPLVEVADSFHTPGGIPAGGTWRVHVPKDARAAGGGHMLGRTVAGQRFWYVTGEPTEPPPEPDAATLGTAPLGTAPLGGN